MIWLLLFLALVISVTLFYLRGEDLRRFDSPPGQSFDAGHEPSDEHDQVVASLSVGIAPIRREPRRKQLALMRDYMDGISEGLDLPAAITPADAGGVPAEWVIAPGADSDRRVLYLHGGAFVMGSPRSHRNLTNRFSEVAGAAVLAIDYRLMPEHPRMAGIEDCRTAYRWLLENGPAGPGAPHRVFVAGDSAGGNLTLSLSAWIRDSGLRQPDGVVALSPPTDSTLGSPSLKANMETDAMLGPMFRGLARVPRPLLWWFTWIQSRMSPKNPVISPVFGDLSGLPPTLVHASEAELLFDDARRYVNRAAAAGSPARLQSWAHVVHVWHMFYPQLTEARDAWEEIGKFVAECDRVHG
ncbi:MAG: alpha/beta hydrolase [Halioglobus sp.]